MWHLVWSSPPDSWLEKVPRMRTYPQPLDDVSTVKNRPVDLNVNCKFREGFLYKREISSGKVRSIGEKTASFERGFFNKRAISSEKVRSIGEKSQKIIARKNSLLSLSLLTVPQATLCLDPCCRHGATVAPTLG